MRGLGEDAHAARRLEVDEEAGHEFDAINTLLLVVVLGLCILAAYLIKKYRFYYMPESAAALLVGLLVGGVARLITGNAEELHFLSFQPELFFFLLLPPIIFEAGYTLRRKHFFRNLGTIVSYAVIGTLISTFIVGYLTFEIGRAGWIRIDRQNPMEALLFGALISAVDPVATLRRAPNLLSLSLSLRPRPRPLLPSPRVADRATAPPSAPAPRRSIMGSAELNCDPLLYSLVFGESVLNDAVAIVLFRTFMGYYEEGASLTGGQILVALLEFLGVSFGSVVVGVVTGLLCSYICRHTRLCDYPKYEISILLLFAYGSYALGEAIELSGIMALFFCGIVLAHYNSYNLSKTSQVTAHEVFESLACLSETFVFMFMGMGFFTGRFSDWDFVFVVMAILFCLLGRALNTFPISAIANMSRSHKVPMRMQFVIWFAGLRGAIAFALSQNMPGAHKEVYETTTLSVVIFTTVVCGGLTEPLLSRMGMKRQDNGTERDDAAYEMMQLSADDDPSPGAGVALHRRFARNLSLGVHGMWKDIDNRYMKPLFGGRERPGPPSDDGDVRDTDSAAAEMH